MSAEVRSQARNPAGSYIVQAPAGSGKTELLTQRILALLATVDEPEEILALTFTRKAAAEMRGRVIESLRMQQPAEENMHKMEAWHLAQAALERSREKEWNLIEHPARLRIMTLDSLTGMLARQLPLLSGLGEMPRPVENAQPAYSEAAEAALNEAMRDHPEAAEAVLLHQDHNTVAVIRLIAEMLGKRDQWLEEVARHARDMAGLRSLIESNLSEIMIQKIAACDALMPERAKSALPALLSFAGMNRDEAQLAHLSSWPEASLDRLEQWQMIACELLTGKVAAFRKPGGVNVQRGFPAGKEFSAQKEKFQHILECLAGVPGLPEALHELRNLPEDPSFDDRQWQILEALFTLLILASRQLKQVFGMQNEADFSEIALRALDALGDVEGRPSDLLLKLDYRIHHILIDEFQDTSRLQIRLLQCLTSGWQQGDGRHRTLFMVGDPMQSIYRFRNAEVGLFLKTAGNQTGLPNVKPLQLERNFRSAPVIVAWVNAAFGAIFPCKQDIVRGAVAYAVADAALSHDGGVRMHVQHGRDDRAEACGIVRIVRDELVKPSRKGTPQRIGILGRARKHLQMIMHALTQADIPFRATKVLPLDSRPEIRVLRALVRALLHPMDRESWAALLRAPCCGLTTADMHALLAGDDRSIWEIVQDQEATSALEARAQARIQHVCHALEPCMRVSGRTGVRGLVESAWLRLGMPQLLDETAGLNVDSALALIEEMDKGGCVDFSLFDERLEKLFAAPDSAPEASRVELLTMHGAKGLQWDVVILPGLGKTTGSTEAPVLAFTGALTQGGAAPLIAPRAPARGRDALYAMVQGIEKSKSDNELARLLYVACTRAETALHMFGHVSAKSGEAEKGSLLALLMPDKKCFGADMDTPESAEQDVAKGSIPLRRIRNLPPPPPDIEIEGGVPEPEYAWAGPVAAPAGNAVHAALQCVADTGIERWNDDDTAEANMRMMRLLIAEGLSGDMLEDAVKRCEMGLQQALASERGRWILSGQHEDVHSEWALSLRDAGQVRQNVIDRSFVDEEGTRWVIDYKTASHEGGDIEAFLDRERKRHAEQLLRYAVVMRRFEDRPIRLGLYFPMLDGWCEVNAG